MAVYEDNRKARFSDYIYILFKWKRILLINLSIIGIIFLIISFIIPQTYKSTNTIMLPDQGTLGFGGLGSLLSGAESALSIGAEVFGIANTNEDLILGILNTKSLLSETIDEFNLMNYYGIDEQNYDKCIKAFRGDLIFEPNEFGLIEVSVIHEDPDTAVLISNFFVDHADNLNKKINLEQATNNREFLEKRYMQNLNDLQTAENEMVKFQEEYGVFAVPEQIKVAVEAAGLLEAQLTEQQLILNAMRDQINSNSLAYRMVQNKVKAIEEKLTNLNNQSIDNSSITIPFNAAPQLQIEFVRKYREVEIQSKLLQFIYPLYEQAKVEENKNIPTILIVDNAVPATEKYAPKKAFIIIIAVFFFFFMHLPFVFRAERLVNRGDIANPLEEKEAKLYSTVKKFYKIK